jgi:hypothetical protein
MQKPRKRSLGRSAYVEYKYILRYGARLLMSLPHSNFPSLPRKVPSHFLLGNFVFTP